MKANRILGVGGIVLAAFAMGTLAQASTLAGVPMSTDTSLSMTGSPVTESGSGVSLADLSFDGCSVDDCSESEESSVAISITGFAAPAISHASFIAPEPATFVLVGLTLAVLPLLRKRRS